MGPIIHLFRHAERVMATPNWWCRRRHPLFWRGVGENLFYVWPTLLNQSRVVLGSPTLWYINIGSEGAKIQRGQRLVMAKSTFRCETRNCQRLCSSSTFQLVAFCYHHQCPLYCQFDCVYDHPYLWRENPTVGRYSQIQREMGCETRIVSAFRYTVC